MIIAFHTHIFPEKIAKRTIDFLVEKGGTPAYHDGTDKGLLAEVERAGIDLAVILPVVTAPKQFESINRFASEINELYKDSSPALLSFGGIHPRCEDIEGKMKGIKEMGLLGVKIHPDYQETPINDEGYVKILECAKEYDLTVVTHAGVDGGYRDRPVMCPPDKTLELIRRVPHSKLVLAHLGGNEMFSEVYNTLAGEDVYFDTAYILKHVGKEMFEKILKKHGEDRILFATDSPWSGIKEDAEILRSFGLGERIEEKIFSENAKKLLNIG